MSHRTAALDAATWHAFAELVELEAAGSESDRPGA